MSFEPQPYQKNTPLTLALGLLWILVSLPHSTLSLDETVDDWLNSARSDLRRAIKVARYPNTNLARNVILFIGDGMGMSTVTAARIHAGQSRGESGEENKLFFEKFPHVGLLKTYNVDQQIPDSAGSASAILSGVKVNYGVVNLDSRVKRRNCSLYSNETILKTILHRFVDAGLSTGVVSNSRITHATPATAYASTPNRSWEGDEEMDARRQTARYGQSASGDPWHGVEDIAKQLIMRNKNIKVILGGGRRYFLDNSTVDPETNKVDRHQRQDGLNLVDEWKKDKEKRNLSHSYVWNKQDFDEVDPWQTEYLLGLFRPSHMNYEGWPRHNHVNSTQPNLVDMTRKAIRVLQNDPKGYFLLVEGARIDWGHHANSASWALRETIELDQAVQMALRLTSRRDTLVIVTADHSHTLAIQGYAPRGTDILGLSRSATRPGTTDGLPYTTLGYTNGAEYGRKDLTNVDTAAPDYTQSGCIPMRVETHAGEDVPAYAVGPMAHLLHGAHEQNYLYHVMEFASCLGWSNQFCQHSHRSKR